MPIIMQLPKENSLYLLRKTNNWMAIAEVNDKFPSTILAMMESALKD